MADDFQKRLDDELGTTLDTLAADRARKMIESRLAAERGDDRLRQAKTLLDALVAPRMQALATKLGLRTVRVGENDRASEPAGWHCAIPLDLAASNSLASYDGDLIVAWVAPQGEGTGFTLRVLSRFGGVTHSEDRNIASGDDKNTEAQAWIDEQLITAAQRHLGIKRQA